MLAEALRTGNPNLDGSLSVAPPVQQRPPAPPRASVVTGRKTQRSPRAGMVASPTAAEPESKRKPRGLAVAIVLGLLMLAVGGTAFGWFGDGSPVLSSKAPDDPRVETLLNEADSAFADDRLTTPEGNSAMDKVEEVLELDPENDEAERLRMQIIAEYEGWGDKSRDEGNYAEALSYYQRAMGAASDTSATLQQKHDEAATLAAQVQEKENNGRGKAKGKKDLRKRLGW
jgi:hypothetical protein